MPKDTVLGLSIGTQLMGLVLARGKLLEDWRMKNFEGTWSKVKLKFIVQFIERYMKRYGVTVLILKIPEPCRSSPAVEALTEALIRMCEREHIPVKTCTIADLKVFFQVQNKTELIQVARHHYSELSYLDSKKNDVQKIYYARIFEAALATML